MNNMTITKAQMKSLINYSRDMLDFDEELFLENAASALVKNIDLARRDSFSVICGPGKKGRIGLKVSRILLGLGKRVLTFFASPMYIDDNSLVKDLKMIGKLDGHVYKLETIGELEDFSYKLNNTNTIIDAIMDIDFDDSYLGTFDYIIETINRSRIYTISIDMPSGIDADTGQVKTVCIEPELIVSLQFAKEGLKKTNRLRGTNLAIEDIGIPHKAINRVLR